MSVTDSSLNISATVNDLNSSAILNDTSGIGWANASLYYSLPSNDPNLEGCKPIILKSELQDFLAWKWWIGGLVMILIEIIGFLANSMSLIVLLRPKIRETSFNQLLAVLCIVDTFFIFCNTFSCIHALGVKNGFFKTVRGFMDAFGQVAMCASVLLIVALTCERHFAIRSPHRYRIHIRTTPWWKHLSYYVVPVTVLSLIFNIPMFINLQRSWMKNTTYLEVNLYLRMLHPLTTTGLAPILILIILNIRITLGIKNMQSKAKALRARPTQSTVGGRPEAVNSASTSAVTTIQSAQGTEDSRAKTSKNQQQNRREIRMAYLTFAIVTLFFLLNLPRIALGGYEVSNTWLILRCVAHGSKYLSTLHSIVGIQFQDY